jgi:hypothetical protein
LKLRALRPCAILLCALLLSGCGLFVRNVPSVTELTGPEGVLPIRRCGEAFLLEATINGRGPYTLLLDTGAAGTAVTPAVASQLSGDTGGAFVPMVGATGKTVWADRRVKVSELRAGPLRLRGFDALVLDMGGFDWALGGRLDGILGYPAFHDVLLTLDYPRSEARVSRERLAPGSDGRTMETPVPDLPRAGLKLGDRYLGFIVDSGSAGELALASSVHIDFESPPKPAGMTLAVGGRQIRRVGRAAGDWQLAGVTLRRPLVETGLSTNIMGAGVLKHFAVSFDQRSGLLRLEPAAPGPIEFESICGIGVATVAQRDGLRIVEVFPGMPAERAGLVPGDVVRTLNGRAVLELICEPERLFPRPGPAVLTVLRDGREIAVLTEAVVIVP